MSTIYDVAQRAGVSAKTVSRVLNGDGPVGQKTRARVQEAIRQLGYVPSQAARMMRSNKSGLIGLITGAISRSTEPTEPTGLPDLYIVQGIQSHMAECGMTLMIADTGGAQDRVAPLIQTFQEHRVEGLIYVADYHREVDLSDAQASCPIHLVNCYDATGLPCVLPDDRAGQQALTQRLLAHGHRRIAYVTLDESMDATRLRSQGYRDALVQAGIAFDPALLIEGHKQDAQDANARLARSIDHLLALPNPPSVICCGNDEMALRLYGHLRRRGMRVPEEISITGYDNYRAIAETLYPPLTTVELPYRAMGESVAARLLEQIASGRAPGDGLCELVASPVVWRDSVTAIQT
ncbi:LacI family DNA-binding transcriptional regulator [Natronohydrobacter thiooxidans]|jgi:LacI family transcriptional regulator|uniref:LacI family DNA-binding transcriptional regulator n=1 Tax=Natronohydrobacter thiooxidans TaxID=87172 RepID=UPI0008FF477B|nr:LacI family DNA-binding transcriptional regulator [Natronohydrobacter thiooxidans]